MPHRLPPTRLGSVRVSHSCRSVLGSTLLFCVLVNMTLLHNWVGEEGTGEVGPRASGSVRLEYHRQGGVRDEVMDVVPTAFPLQRLGRNSATGYYSTRRSPANKDGAAKSSPSLVSTVECSRMEAWTDVCM